MVFRYYGGSSGVLVTMVVLFVFAGNSDAEIPSEFSNINNVEKIVTSHGYQDGIEASIMGSSDKISKIARATIETIRKDALSVPRSDNGVFQDAIDELIDSILTAVRIVLTAERLAREKFESAKNLTLHDPKAAADSIQKNIKYLTYFLITACIPIEDTFGSALALAGGSNQKQIKKSMDAIQIAGNFILASLKVAENLAITGIDAGDSAAIEGCNAALEAFHSGCTAAFEAYDKSAQYALEGLSSVVLQEDNRVPRLIESLKTEVSINNPAGLAAIARLQFGFKSMLSGLDSQAKIDAAKIMTQALTSTILETADAVSIAEKAIVEAGELASRDKDAAVALIHKGIKVAREEVIRGTTIGFLGFGAARFIAGGVPIDGLINAMVEIILGRIAVYDGLKNAEDMAIIGIDAGGLATAQAVNAALRICEAAGNELYIQFVESAEIGFNIFHSI